jgi:hypothetical protein
LNSQIRLTILKFSSSDDYSGEYDEGSSEYFSNDLTQKQKLSVSLNSAIRILRGNPDQFEWKSPVMTVKRKGGVHELAEKLQEMLSDAEGGRFAINIDTDIDAIIQSFERYTHAIDRSLSAWNGSGQSSF